MDKSCLVLAGSLLLFQLVAFADEVPKYYFAASKRKMNAGVAPKTKAFAAPKTGRASLEIPGAMSAESESGKAGGLCTSRRYFTGQGGNGSFTTRTIPLPEGIRSTGAGIELPMRTFTMSAGTVMVPYVPLPDVNVRIGTTGQNPYYSPPNRSVPY